MAGEQQGDDAAHSHSTSGTSPRPQAGGGTVSYDSTRSSRRQSERAGAGRQAVEQVHHGCGGNHRQQQVARGHVARQRQRGTLQQHGTPVALVEKLGGRAGHPPHRHRDEHAAPDRIRADRPAERQPEARHQQGRQQGEHVEQQDAQAEGHTVPDLRDRRRARGRRQRGVVAALDGGGDALDEDRPDRGGDRQEQPERQQRGAHARCEVGRPRHPAMQGEVHEANRGEQQRRESRRGEQHAAQDHAEEGGVAELAEGEEERFHAATDYAGARTDATAAAQTQECHVSGAQFDIAGIGNAIVDVVARTDDHFLTRRDMRKGGMALIDAIEAIELYSAMPPGQESSGGSVANTCAVAAMLGARVAYLGKVAADQLGGVFGHDITAAGVHFPTEPLAEGAPTARCLILVTPDGQRTMNTFLGAAVAFGEDDVDTDLIAASAVTYLEGYLFDPPAAQAAFRLAARAAHAAGRQVALSLSDPFCVDRHRSAFRALIREVDILFANEAEVTSLYEVNSFEEAITAAGHEVKLAALTQSEAGSVIVHGNEALRVKAAPAIVVDTTGAGDAYAAGFLAAHTRGLDLAECGRIASAAAADVVGQLGA